MTNVPIADSRRCGTAALRWSVGRQSVAVAAGLLFAFGVLATAWRTVDQYQTPGLFQPDQQGYCDFHNGIYFPAQALVRGESPYGPQYARQYPVARQIPFFLPSVLLLHGPLTLLPLGAAEIFYFVFSVALILVISVVIASLLCQDGAVAGIRLDHVFVIAAVMVTSRGGHITLFDGYFTFELVLATFLAIHFGSSRPLLSASALALVASKPNFIVALGFLMLARGDVKSVVWGAVLTIVTAGLPSIWIAYHEGGGDIGVGLQRLSDHIHQSQEIHRGQLDESPVYSWTRIDLLAIIAKWTGSDPREATHLLVMGVILAPILWLLDRRRRAGVDDGLLGMTGALMLTATLVSVYHQSYDALVLMPPLAGIIFGTRSKTWRNQPRWVRCAAAVLMLAPLYNYLSTRLVLEVLGWGLDSQDLTGARIFTSINGVALAVLLALLVWLASRESSSRTVADAKSLAESG